MPEKKRLSLTDLGHLPGLLILALSMLSLYYSALLIHTKHNIQYNYDVYENKLMAFETAYEEVKDHVQAEQSENLEADERDAFINMNNAFNKLNISALSGLKTRDVSLKSYDLLLYKIQGNIKELFDLHAKQKRPEKNNETQLELKSKIYEMNQNVRLLRLTFFDMFTRQIFSEQTQKIENILYWSILAMGLCGFVLMVFNSHRLRQLKLINQEKRETVEDLESKIAALDMAYEGVWIANRAGEIVFLNASMCDMLGVEKSEKQEILGEVWHDVILRSDEKLNEWDIFPKLADQGYWRGEYPVAAQNGDEQTFTDMTITHLPNGGVIGTMEDLTDKHKALTAKKELEKQFYQAQKMEAIGLLAGGIAHDFNNILAAMNGYAEFLIDDLDGQKEQQDYAKNILNAGLQARGLVDQMLTFSRRSNDDKTAVDLVKTVKEAHAMLGASLPKTINLKQNLYTVNAIINANSAQISQMIMNLCVNAQDAMEQEKGTLEVSVEELSYEQIKPPQPDDTLRTKLPEEQETPYLNIKDISENKARLILGHLAAYRNYIRLTVSDNGSGMPRNVMERIFEPFFTTKSVDKGTGLGLSTVHGLVISHQAMLVITSEMKKGTTFEIYFPTLIGKNESENAETGMDKNDIDEELRQTILVVEDQDNVRKMVVEMIERLGHDVYDCSNAKDAIQVVEENPDAFDVIVSDQNMPEMTGIDMIQILHERYPDLPFIIISGYSEQKIQSIIDKHPAIRAVLRKPVPKDILAHHINCVSKLKKSA